jgi:hypothetical protein
MCLRVSYKKNFFCILKVTEERSGIRSWIQICVVRGTDPRIWICSKMSRIPNTDLRLSPSTIQKKPGLMTHGTRWIFVSS